MSLSLQYDDELQRIFSKKLRYFEQGVQVIDITPLDSVGVTKYEFSFIDTIITNLTIPDSGVYRLEAWGADGGGGASGPKGAYSKSFVKLKKGENIQILVGERGYNGYNDANFIYCGGAGGGTFIAKDKTPLCVAGGGGSNSYYSHDDQATYACGQKTRIGGNPGSGAAEETYGGNSGACSSGGGGFLFNGKDKATKGAIAFVNGGKRQVEGVYQYPYGYGGFGGGGSVGGYTYSCCCCAGGGGYTGGSASSVCDRTQGGGGGSIFTGEYGNEKSEAISGCEQIPQKPNLNGYAIIELIKGNSIKAIVTALTCHKYNFLWTLYATLQIK